MRIKTINSLASIALIILFAEVGFFVGAIREANRLPVMESNNKIPHKVIKKNNLNKEEKTPLLNVEFYKIIEEKFANTTAYNTVSSQTDSSPCLAANGSNICGRKDAIACPRNYKLGTLILIGNRIFECVDRTASKFNGRFDISFDKDIEGALKWGRRKILIKVLDKQ